MSQHGGISTLIGIRYEVQFGVYKLLDILEGHATTIRYQPPTSALSSDQLPNKIFVDDYSVQEVSGKKSFFQVKHNSKDSSWTINRLISEGVLEQFWNQYHSEPECNLFFISDIPAPQLKSLADQARRHISFEEFEQTLHGEMQDSCQKITKKLGINLQDMWRLMKAVDNDLRTENNMQELILNYASYRYSDPEKFALVLKDLIENSLGVCISNDTIVEHLDKKGLFRIPIPLSQDVKTILRHASGLLRIYKSDIAGIHIPRKEPEKLEQWIKTTTKEHPIAFLLDSAGTGKSVILHDLLEKLENQDVPVLAIKSDGLTGVINAETLKAKLNLSSSPESLLAEAAKNSIAVLIVDQLDALSLTFSRNQECLNTIIDLIGRAISIPNVRVVVSCRTFDRKFDPILKQIRSTDDFNIEPLNQLQIQPILDHLGITWEDLTAREQSLLASPHFLETFANVIKEINRRGIPRHPINTIQDLYDSLWDTKILKPHSSSVLTNQIQNSIYLLVDKIHQSQELLQSVTLLDDVPEVRTYLQSEGILRGEGTSLMFFHQSFFDYCYARRFVLQNMSLAKEIRKGHQGFFIRPQIVQVLTYLRSANRIRYYSELECLMDRGQIKEWLRRLKSSASIKKRALSTISALVLGRYIRFHVRQLVFAVFGQTTNLDQREKALGLNCLRSSDDRHLFLLGSHGNIEWFDVVYPELTNFLTLSDKSIDEEVIPFLRSVQDDQPDKIYSFFLSQLGKSDRWESRIVWCMNISKAWHSKELEKCLIWICRNGQNPWYELELALHEVAKTNPILGCQAFKIILERLRDQWLKLETPLTAEQAPRQDTSTDKNESTSYLKHFQEFENYAQRLLPDHLLWTEELVKQASSSSPGVLLEILLHWLEDILPKLTWRSNPRGWLRDQIFSSPSLHNFRSPDSAIIQGIRLSLLQLAKTDSEQFLTFANRIEGSRYLILHQFVVEALIEQASIYAPWALQYLLKDSIRFQIGDLASATLFSRKLIGAIFPHLNSEGKSQLEKAILSYYPEIETMPENRRFRGSDQLELLWEVPDSLLTTTGQKVRRELQRKFENFKLPEPWDIEMVAVTSPIPEDKAHLLNDDEWLNAMRSYNDETGWGKPRENALKGGVVELSRIFQKVVQAQPERFVKLIKQFNQSISSQYFEAALTGLAESKVSATIFFEACEYTFKQRPNDILIHNALCRAIEKRLDNDIPTSVMEIVRDIALYSNDPDHEERKVEAANGKHYDDGDPHSNGINTARGTAVGLYMKYMLKSSSEDIESLLGTFEQFANDTSSAVLACLIEFLPSALRLDSRRVIGIFNRIIKAHSELLASYVSHDFIYYAIRYSTSEMLRYIESLTHSDLERVREVAGRLATIAYLVTSDGRTLYRYCIREDIATKQGVAEVLARNVDQHDLLQKCLTGLNNLMHDSNKEVREKIGKVFEYLPSPTNSISHFVHSFIHSRSLANATRYCMEYAERIQLEYPELALAIAERIQSKVGKDIIDIQKASALLDNDLVNIAISIQTHTPNIGLKSRAMDLFERVLDLGSRYANKALAEIDR